MSAGAEHADGEIRVAFLGLGGAGQRHARVLRSMLGWSTEWLAIRSRGTTPVLNAAFEPQTGSVSEAYHLRTMPTLDAALEQSPDLVVVATPTALHRDGAVRALEAGCPVLVEKPLAATLADAAAVADVAEAMQLAAFVGFQRRHHPAWTRTESHVRAGGVGTLTSVSMWCRSDVTAWHPYEPLEGLYAVRADLGGGVIATECHEVDQLVGLLGLPSSVHCEASTPPDSGQVERSAEVALEYESGPRCTARISLSFEEPVPQRGWELVGREGSIRWDESAGELVLVGRRNERQNVRIEGFGNEDLVAVQNRWVVDHRVDHSTARPGLERARDVSAIIEAARRSRRSGEPSAPTHPQAPI